MAMLFGGRGGWFLFVGGGSWLAPVCADGSRSQLYLYRSLRSDPAAPCTGGFTSPWRSKEGSLAAAPFDGDGCGTCSSGDGLAPQPLVHPQVKSPAMAGLFCEAVKKRGALLDLGFFVHHMLPSFGIKFFDLHLLRHGFLVFGGGVEVPGSSRGLQFDLFATALCHGGSP